MSKTLKIVVLILVIAGIAYAAYRYYKSQQKPAAKPPVHLPDPQKPGNLVVSDIANGLEPDLVVKNAVNGNFSVPQPVG